MNKEFLVLLIKHFLNIRGDVKLVTAGHTVMKLEDGATHQIGQEQVIILPAMEMTHQNVPFFIKLATKITVLGPAGIFEKRK